jgi:hypothetical protein
MTNVGFLLPTRFSLPENNEFVFGAVFAIVQYRERTQRMPFPTITSQQTREETS